MDLCIYTFIHFFHIHFHCLVAHKNAGVLFIFLIQPSSRFDQIAEREREREQSEPKRLSFSLYLLSINTNIPSSFVRS